MIEAAGREVRLSNPGEAVLQGCRPGDRQTGPRRVLPRRGRRRPDPPAQPADDAEALRRRSGGEFFFQKRIPKGAPDWLESATVHFPSGRSARELVRQRRRPPRLGGQSRRHRLQPVAVPASRPRQPRRAPGRPRPDPGGELGRRPQGGADAPATSSSTTTCRLPEDVSGNRGIHVNVRIEPEWGFDDVRRAALALAREVERRVPKLATSKWWKEERHGVFVDYNQNARDRTVASAYSVRPSRTPGSAPRSTGTRCPTSTRRGFTLRTVPDRLRDVGDPSAAIDEHAGGLENCSSSRPRTRRRALATPPGRPTSASRRGSGSGSRRAGLRRIERGAGGGATGRSGMRMGRRGDAPGLRSRPGAAP